MPRKSKIKMRDLRALAREGMTRHEIAAQLGVSYPRVSTLCTALNITTRRGYRQLRPRRSEPRNAAIVTFAETHTLRETAHEFGLSHQRISQILRRAGVYRDDPHDRPTYTRTLERKAQGAAARAARKAARRARKAQRAAPLVRMRLAGMTYQAIAERTGKHVVDVHRIILAARPDLRRVPFKPRWPNGHQMLGKRRKQREKVND